MRLKALRGIAYIQPDSGLVRAAIGVGSAAEAIAILRPIVFMILIDRLITSASLDTIATLVLALAVIAALDSWLNYKKSVRLAEASAITFGDVAFGFWSKFHGTSRTDGRGAGPSETAEIIPRLYSAATAHCALRYTIAVEVAAAGFALLVLAWLNVWMTLIILAALPLVFFNELRSRRSRDNVNAELVASSSKLRQRVDEMILGQPNLMQVGRSNFASSYIWESLTGATAATVNQQRYQSKTVRASGLIQTIAALLILLVGAGLVASDLMSVGALIAFDMLGGQLRAKITTVMQVYTTAKDQEATFDRMDQILEGRDTHAFKGKVASANRVQCVNLSFAYSETSPVIDELTYDFAGGNVYAITGPSGAGKSTLGKLLAGHLAGTGAVSYELDKIYAHPVVYLPQDAWVFGGSIYDNILLSEPTSAPTQGELDRAHKAARDAGIRNLESLASNPGEFGRRLSGGQKQRVHLARALAHSTAVFVADEPSSALDGPLKATIGLTLREKAADGAVVILITHDEELIAAADVVLALSEGRLEPLDDLLDKSKQRGRRGARNGTDSAIRSAGHPSRQPLAADRSSTPESSELAPQIRSVQA